MSLVIPEYEAKINAAAANADEYELDRLHNEYHDEREKREKEAEERTADRLGTPKTVNAPKGSGKAKTNAKGRAR